jgi:hypothetical protein
MEPHGNMGMIWPRSLADGWTFMRMRALLNRRHSHNSIHLWREQHCGPVLAADGVQDTAQGQVVNGLVFMDLQGHILLRGERDDAPGQRAGQGRLAGLAQALGGDGQRAGRADPGCGTHRAPPPPRPGLR